MPPQDYLIPNQQHLAASTALKIKDVKGCEFLGDCCWHTTGVTELTWLTAEGMTLSSAWASGFNQSVQDSSCWSLSPCCHHSCLWLWWRHNKQSTRARNQQQEQTAGQPEGNALVSETTAEHHFDLVGSSDNEDFCYWVCAQSWLCILYSNCDLEWVLSGAYGV